jgi:2-dehydro-3-deoxyglucarate aldolase/4-hydroxy-2-oxoheptanedioate aldolase
MGAMGVMVPMVESAEQARRIADSCRYPPVGRRGAAFTVAHDDYTGGDILEKMRTANAEVLLIAQIETARGLEHAEEIAAVEGIDVLWIGHFDLTNFLGIPGQFSHPKFNEAIDRVSAACRKHEKAGGFMVTSPDEARLRLEQGFRCLAYGGDLWMYQQTLSSGLQAVQKIAGTLRVP